MSVSTSFNVSRWRALALAAALAMGAGAPGLAQAREGVTVEEPSVLTRLVPAEQLERAAQQQYAQIIEQARAQNALLPDNHPQVQRLRSIAQRIVPHALPWNKRARQWQWQVVLLRSKDLNAFCMPGGKIAFYTGILEQLKLTDDEVAMIMGHEIAHALREHARERVAKQSATRIGVNVISGLFGLGSVGDAVLSMGGQLLTLTFSRQDESEADLVGMELAARAGYDPRAGVSLWQKMTAANKGAPPQWLSTHPSGNNRIKEIQANLPKVVPLFDRADKPPRRFDQPLRFGQAYYDTLEPLAYWGRAQPSEAATHAHRH
ncbi:M48 family metallopeptidase [Aquabacterium sp. A3]|uniref:M48 family metallopeptidase n=1 Tax=Aquabacterium sp. A3 TaxID=3132829 RepID=UPI003119FBE1